MPLNKAQLTADLLAAFEAGKADPDWTLAQAAGAMADAIDAYVRTAGVTGITTTVADFGNAPIGTGTQSGAGTLT